PAPLPWVGVATMGQAKVLTPPNHMCPPPQITESTIEITQSSKDIDAARSTVVDLRRSVQTLEIDLESLRNQKAGLEANLLEVENRYGMQMEQLNGLILRAEAELGQVRSEVQRQAEEYQALLNVKGKLEAERGTYRQLLEGGEEFRGMGWD
ncbi:K1C18 protein, partial [Nyctibius bracteatus]|nr:K1C18 protein [Nyctibius bracteatus]